MTSMTSRFVARTLILVGISLVALAGTGFGQAVCGTFDQDQYSTGQPIQFTVTTVTPAGVTLPSSCAFGEIRSGSPTGPLVFAPACLAVLVPLAQGQSTSLTWNQTDQNNQQVPQGDYWFGVSYFDGAFSLTTEWFCTRIADAPSVTLSGPNLVAGGTTNFQLQSPVSSFGFYVVVASITSNVGIPAGLTRLCIDQDFVFNLSFPTPNPAIFTNFQGNLDALGNSPPIGITIPNVPIVQGLPFKIQGAVITSVGPLTAVTASNALNRCVQ